MASTDSERNPVEQLAEEFATRRRRGEYPTIDEYCERFPQWAEEIRGLFPALLMMERLGADEELGDTVEAIQAPAKLSQLGDFRIIREVGRGGMGIVYEAEQVSLGRRVALKVLPKQALLDSRHKQRFLREAKAAARLHHTNIVPVFGVGEQEGLHYYVMQFIYGLGLDEVLVELRRLRKASVESNVECQGDGAARGVSAAAFAQSLVSGRFERTLLVDSEVSEQPSTHSTSVEASTLSPQPSTSQHADTVVGQLSDTLPGHSSHSRNVYCQSVARIGLQAGEALQYAHDQGVIHRDIKPGNLLLDTRGGVWVTDFGLAKAADQQDLTHTGDVLGTLRYMAPEQFEGRADARSDVFSLGLTLYELFALKPAFDETERHRLIKQVTTGAPPRLRSIDRTIPRDLETIVHKAIDRDPAHRYQTAGELAADLQRYLGNEPIRAKWVSPVTRFSRWCRRNPAGATVVALMVIGLISSCAAAAVFLEQAEENAELAETERELKQQAQDALAVAERERARADENFEQAWSAVDNFYATVSQNRLLNVPGMQPLRRDLLTDALDYYRQFIEQESGNPDLQKELADAQLGLARISRELGLPEQREAFRNALTLYRELSRQSPDDPEIQHGLATCCFWLGSNLQAIDIWDGLLETDPENAVYRQHLGDALNSLASRQDEEQNYEAALVTHQRALILRMELLRADPNDPQLHADLGSTLNNIGVLLARKERYEEALIMYRQSVAHDEFAFEHDPGNILYGRFFAISGGNIAHLEERFGRSEEAEWWFRRAAEVRARIASANPDVASLQSDAYDAWRLLAEHLKGHGQPEEAADAFRRAGDVLERLPQRTPDELFNLARVYALASASGSQPDGTEDQRTPEQLAESRQLANLAVDALERAVNSGFSEPERLETEADLAALRARPEFGELLSRVESLSEFEGSRPAELEASAESDERADLAAAQYSIGLLKTLFDEPDEALQALTRSAELREELLESRPHDRTLRTALAETYQALADLAWRNDCYVDARGHWVDVFRVLEGGETNGQLARAYSDCGTAFARTGLLDEALPFFSKADEVKPGAQTEGGLVNLGVGLLAEGEHQALREVTRPFVDRYDSAVVLLLLPREQLDESELNGLLRRVADWKSSDSEWLRRAYMLAMYRCERFEDVLAVTPLDSTTHPGIQAGFVRVMALRRLGRVDEALRELELTLEHHIKPYTRVNRPSGSHLLPQDWYSWFIAEHLRKEAEALILGSPRPQQPLVSLDRARAYALLGNTERAEELFNAAVEAAPDDALVRLVRVRYLAEAGLMDRATTEFPQGRDMFLADPTEDPEDWRQLALAARACDERQVAADAFATALERQTELCRDSPADNGRRNSLDALYDELAAALTALGRDADLRAARIAQQELHDQLAVNPLTTIKGHAAPYVWSVAVLPDGRRALSAAQDGNVCLWDLETGEEIRRFEHHGPVLQVACLPGGDQFLTAGYDTTIRLWDIESGEVVREFEGHTDHIAALAVSADGARMVSGGEDETLRVWDVATGELLQTMPVSGTTRCLAVSPDGRRALSGPLLAESYAVVLWDLETGHKLREFTAHDGSVYCVSFSADGRRAVSGDHAGLVVLWDVETGDELQRWEGNWREARDATFLEDGRILLATGSGALAILDAENGRVIQRLDGTIRHYDLAILPDRYQVLTGDADATVRLWSLPLLAPPDEAAELIARQFDALAPAPGARARLIAQMANSSPVMDRLLELRPGEPQLQIAHAKAIAVRGDWSAAEEELDSVVLDDAPERVVRTGWWMAGPYEGDMQLRWPFFPPTENLDPIRPVNGSPDLPWQLAWNRVSPDASGRFVFKPVQDTNPCGTYLLTRLYAQQPLDTLFLISADDMMSLWMNGEPIESATVRYDTEIPIQLSLRSGWNTLLLKITNGWEGHDVRIRRVLPEEMSDVEWERLLVQEALVRGEWQLALERWGKLTAEHAGSADSSNWDSLVSVLATSGDFEQQETLLRALAAWHTGDRSEALRLYRGAVAGNQIPYRRNSRLSDLRGCLEGLLEVEQELTEAIRLQPDSAERWRDRANFHVRRGEYGEAATDFQSAVDRAPPTIVEPEWRLTRTTILPGASAAHFSPRDGAVYVGTRYTAPTDGVYRINADGAITRLCDADRVSCVVVAPDTGDVFFSEDYSGSIYRIDGKTGHKELWVAHFKRSDSDPFGMAFVPPEFADDQTLAGDLLVVDHGWQGDDEIYAVSTRQSQKARLLHRDGPDVGPLVNPTDLAVAGEQLYLVDTGEGGPGRIYRLKKDGRLLLVETAEEIRAPVGVTADPLTGDLLVLDRNRKGVVRVNPATGAVTNCIARLSRTGTVDISPDGMQLFVTDPGAAAIFTFTRTPLGLARQCVRPLLQEGRWDEAAEQLNAALEEQTEPYVIQSDWWVTGPYPYLGKGESHFPPEENFDPLQPVAGSGMNPEQPDWKIAELEGNGRLNFTRLFSGSELRNAVSYALTRIYASDDQTVLYHVDVDDRMLLWVNGQSADLAEFHDVLQIPLQRGWNTLLAKVWNSDGGYYLAANLVQREQVIEELTAQIAAARGDPDLLIQRGRWYAELGEQEEADADFDRAASLGPLLAKAPFSTDVAEGYQHAWASRLGVPVQYTNSIGMTLRLIPSGEFIMGTPRELAEQLVTESGSKMMEHERSDLQSEGPPRPVRLSQPFYLGRFEVTRAQFREFVDSTGYLTEAESSGLGGWSNLNGEWGRRPQHVWFTPGDWVVADDQAVCLVTWNDAQAFCDWLSEKEGLRYVLPTEAQWEFACRAGTETATYAGTGESLADIAWTSELMGPIDAERHHPRAVGLKRPNAFGLYDMLGNVWEACTDWYELAPEQSELLIDPTGPEHGESHVFRGGAWYRSGKVFGHAGARIAIAPDGFTDAGVGFRVAIVGDLSALSDGAIAVENLNRSAVDPSPRTVEPAGSDPMPLIHRGRWYAGRGEHEKADADFVKAASLTPDELNRFLEAGWWVVGPYPANLDEFCPPEIDPNPSQPVHTIEPQTGLSNEPVAWRHVPTGPLGEFQMADVLGPSNGSGYALAYVYSPHECTRLLRVGDANGIRVWCNGESVFRADEAITHNPIGAKRVPVALQRGRNTILVRAGLNARVTLRVADTPLDEFLSMAALGLWDEAVDVAFATEPSVFGEQIHDEGYFAAIRIALASGNEQILEREGDRLLQMALGYPSLWNQVRAAGVLALVDNPLARKHVAELETALINKLPETSGNQNLHRECLRALADCALLTGDTDATRQYLLQLHGGSDEFSLEFAPVWALVREREGSHEEALAALEVGFPMVSCYDGYWPWLASFQAQMRNAELQITGSTTRTDELIASQRSAVLAGCEDRDPATAAFDHFVATRSRFGNKGEKSPRPWLARGRRLAELGRFDDAEADFNKAVELAADDPEVVTQRAEFYARAGQTEKAAAEFAAALELTGWSYSRTEEVINLTLARFPEVWEAVRQLRPRDHRLWLGRGRAQAFAGQWEQAIADYDRAVAVQENAIRRNAVTEYAALRLLAGDEEGFLEACDRIAAVPAANPTEAVVLLRTRLLSPRGFREASGRIEEATTLIEEDSGFWGRHAAGLASYRRGDFEESLRMLKDSLTPNCSLQQLIMSWSVMAMAEHRLGHVDESRKWLRMLDAARNMNDQASSVASQIQPTDWLMAQVLSREAKRLVDGENAVPTDDLLRSPETTPEQPQTSETPDP